MNRIDELWIDLDRKCKEIQVYVNGECVYIGPPPPALDRLLPPAADESQTVEARER